MRTSIFLISFFAYIGLMILLGWYVSRGQKSGEDFLLAGRNVPFALLLGTTLATVIGTGSSMGAIGFAYLYGWGGMLYGMANAIGMLLLMLVFAKMRRHNFMTMSEEVAYYYGANKTIKTVVAIFMFFTTVGWLGVHILGGGLYLAWVAGINLTLAKILVAMGFAIYAVIGGYIAVIWTDSIQAIVLFFGFILMAVIALTKVGGLIGIEQQVSAEKLSFLGSAQLGIIPIISIVFSVVVSVMAHPTFRQRIYAGKTVSVVKKSLLVTAIFALLFSLLPVIIGLSAYVLNPQLDNNYYAFPYFALEVLPLSLGVIILLAGLSATMSSASSDAISSLAILMRDIYQIIFGHLPDKFKVVNYSRIGLLLIISLAVLFTMTTDDIINYIVNMTAMIMSGLFVTAMLGRFWQRVTWQGALASIIAGFITSIIILNHSAWLAFWGNPTIPAVSAAFSSAIIISLLTPRNKISRRIALKLLRNERQQMEMKAEH